MSIDSCKKCGTAVDTDFDDESYQGLLGCRCESCRDQRRVALEAARRRLQSLTAQIVAIEAEYPELAEKDTDGDVHNIALSYISDAVDALFDAQKKISAEVMA